MSYTLRTAEPADAAGLALLIERSARALSAAYYTDSETEAAIRHVFGVDSRLIADRTYFVVEDARALVGCGGWSHRRTLYAALGFSALESVTDLLPDGTSLAFVRMGREL